MDLETISILITNHKETFTVVFTFISLVLSVVQVVFIYKTLTVAEKFEAQHLVKLKIEEFFKNRKEIFDRGNTIRKSMNRVLSYTVEYNEIYIKSDNQLEYWRSDEEQPCPMYYFNKTQIASIFFKKLNKEKDSLFQSIEALDSFLLLFDDDELNQKYLDVKSKVHYWSNLLELRNRYGRPFFEAISRSVDTIPDISAQDHKPSEETIHHLRNLMHLRESDNFQVEYSLRRFNQYIDSFQNELNDYLKRISK